MNASPRTGEARALAAAVALATLLAVALRAWDVTGQVVLDDEWHAIHKLAGSSYRNIVRSFGIADHSIPLTLLYKAMADTIGLAEGRLRILQVACGAALVPTGAWLAWRATRDAPASALFAFLLSAAPFLVLWSRVARPYAVVVLLTVLCIGALWHWRSHRTRRVAAAVAVAAALSAWFHPLSGLYAATGWLYVFLEDAAAPGDVRPRPSRRSIALGAAIAGASLVLLAAPLIHDRKALAFKAGGDRPGLETFDRMLSIFWGGLPTPLLALATLLAAWGAIAILRRDRRLGAYLLLLTLVPPAFVAVSGAVWVDEGQNLARYVLPMQVLVLFFGAVGLMSITRELAGRRAEAAAWTTAALLSAGYLAATPTLAQVAALGPWYAHPDYHWDYRIRGLASLRGDPGYDPPAFYRELGRLPAQSITIIEAPFVWEGPFDPYDYYATFHRQRELFGMLHDLCRDGLLRGEPPEHDPRFRFRLFVFLDDPDAVRSSGARYLVLNRTFPRARPFPEAGHCVAKLAALYGAPIEDNSRLTVFDLSRRPSAISGFSK